MEPLPTFERVPLEEGPGNCVVCLDYAAASADTRNIERMRGWILRAVARCGVHPETKVEASE